MPLQQTSGNVTADAYGGGVAAVPQYIEDVFSTWLYTGNGSTQTITNNIDISGKGGLVWIKSRSNAKSNSLFDTERGAYKWMTSNGTNASTNFSPNSLTSFNSDGFSLLDDATSTYAVNGNGYTYASWTFRKQPKFFDVVTYIGDGTSYREINHSLGSVPGSYIIKKTSATENWFVWHRSNSGQFFYLNTTAAAMTAGAGDFGADDPSSTKFYCGDNLNTNGATYVAYLFAHDAGGFGLTGTDNVISCGSFTSGGSGEASVNLGYEPQLIIWKSTGYAQNWYMHDNMRGLVAPNASSSGAALYPNTSGAESNPNGNTPFISATGFSWDGTVNSTGNTGQNYIYIAIRRGPMKVPTSGTSVFQPVTYAGNSSTNRTISTGIVTDMFLTRARTQASTQWPTIDRLRGPAAIYTDSNEAEFADASILPKLDVQNGWNNNQATGYYYNASGDNYINYAFRRAPSFFDEVCYTGTGTAMTVAHNLGVAPEMMIVKNRSNPTSWAVYSPIGATKVLTLNTTNAETTFSGSWNNTAPTSSVFTVGNATGTNQSGSPMVAYLFATCAGVSKVGSYTGTGALQTVNCGFTGGARFVLIKRTDSTGDWYVWDTARGMVSGTDPSLLLNSTAAEVNANSIYTATGGFQIVSTAAGINASGGSYIFLAIS